MLNETIENHIITAANARYFKNLKQLLFSFRRSQENKNSVLIIYDLGLTPDQVGELKELERRYKREIFYRSFDFNLYPEFVKPQYNNYSWKPIIVHLVASEITGNFLWMDSANCILKNLAPIWDEIDKKCTFAPICGSGPLKEWTIQATLDYLDTPLHYYQKRNRAGNTFGFSTKCKVVKALLERWRELALIKECALPKGAKRSNHKYDQSLLTILLLEEEEKGSLELTNAEVNISSPNPTPFISVRNLFPQKIPIKAGLMAHYYFLTLRIMDIYINKLTRVR